MPLSDDERRKNPILQPGSEPVPGYRLVKHLGTGGFGEVWMAEGPGGFRVALKFVRLDEKAGSIEARGLGILKDIRHPNLLTTFGTWQIPGFLVIAMELADRTLLDRLHEAVGQGLIGIAYEELIEYLSEAAKGIDYLNAHQHTLDAKQGVGVQHRDIKPQNILLVGNGVKVADFGLARLLEHTVTGHTGSFTISYAAPEFFQYKTSSTSDQYSLAVSYCELCGGRLPFMGSPYQIMAGHMRHPPDLTMLSAEARPVVARALAKDPQQRWDSCRSFVKALRACRPSATPLSGCPAIGAMAAPVESHATIGPTSSSLSVRSAEWQEPYHELAPAPPGSAPRKPPGSINKEDTAPHEGFPTDPDRQVAKAPAPRPVGPRWKRKVMVWSMVALVLAATLIPWAFRGPQPLRILSLHAPGELTLQAGAKHAFTVRVTRQGIDDPIAVQIEKLPPGVTASQVTIPANQSAADVELTVGDNVQKVERETTLIALAGRTESRASLKLILEPAAPNSKEITNSVGMELVLIPAGRFLMGSPDSDKDAEGEEKPQHEVEITKAFWLGKYVVTRGQFRQFVEDSGYKTDAKKDGLGGWGYDLTTKSFKGPRQSKEKPALEGSKTSYSWRDVGFAQTDEHPVVNVSWNDAKSFCNWLSKKEGLEYRLPTEAEWEYSCRAGTTTRFYSGDDVNSLMEVANVADASFKERNPQTTEAVSWNDGFPFTAPVGRFKPNGFGLYDMHGNVWQWCTDWYGRDYYQTSPRHDPQGPSAGIYRMRRGGSFGDAPYKHRAAYHSGNLPVWRNDNQGFRVVLVPPAQGDAPKRTNPH